jgi:hypothetical protein
MFTNMWYDNIKSCRPLVEKGCLPVEQEERHAEAEPDADEDQLLDRGLEVMIHNLQTYVRALSVYRQTSVHNVEYVM